MHHIENKMGDFAMAHNELGDAHNEQEEKVKLLKSMTDLEDRSRRDNAKFRGITERILPADLDQYVQQMISTLLPSVPEREFVVDRAHWLPSSSTRKCPQGCHCKNPLFPCERGSYAIC